jgi:hypothetical protein
MVGKWRGEYLGDKGNAQQLWPMPFRPGDEAMIRGSACIPSVHNAEITVVTRPSV